MRQPKAQELDPLLGFLLCPRSQPQASQRLDSAVCVGSILTQTDHLDRALGFAALCGWAQPLLPSGHVRGPVSGQDGRTAGRMPGNLSPGSVVPGGSG